MAPAQVIEGGATYRIVNAKSQTLLDLSQADFSSSMESSPLFRRLAY